MGAEQVLLPDGACSVIGGRGGCVISRSPSLLVDMHTDIQLLSSHLLLVRHRAARLQQFQIKFCLVRLNDAFLIGWTIPYI